MYLNFFNFSEEPFRTTPDPKFLFLSRQHEEAIASVTYGIEWRKGFMAVIGDVGTGKTTICRTLLERLDKNTDTSVIFNPMISIVELLEAINDDFGNTAAAESTVKGQLDTLNKFLLRRLKWNKNAVVLIDEAQNLSVEALEMLRMLSNLETENKKLLQIILVGQPELEQKLRRPDLRQLNQRITVKYFLGALNYHECACYMVHRLKIAGGEGFVRFDKGAVERIFEHSEGVPRLINIICDRALLLAYSEKTRLITKDIVKRSIIDVTGESNLSGFVAIFKKPSRFWSKFFS